MNKTYSILFVAAIIAFCSCKKEEDIPVYETGQGRITGQTDNGINFDVEGKRAYFNIYRAAAVPTFGVKDNLFIYAHIDTIISRHFSIMLGAYDNREGMYYLDDLVGEDHNTAYFSPQGSPQVTYYLYYTAGLRSYVNITRVKGTYIEGSYFVRLSLMGNSTGPFITVEGTFKGNCRVLG